MPHNIAQLEFFLYLPENIESIAREVATRARDGMRIKLVVRIFDTTGELTAQAKKADALRVKSDAFHRQLPEDFSALSRWRSWQINRQSRKLAGQSLDISQRMLQLGVQALRETIRRGDPIALEKHPGASFRLMRHEELHELLEAARRAHSVWVFIFAPAELVADRVTLVVRSM